MWGATSVHMYNAYTNSTSTYACTHGRNWMGGGWWVVGIIVHFDNYVEPHVSDVPCAPVAAGR